MSTPFSSKTIFVCSNERCARHKSVEIYEHIAQRLQRDHLTETISLQWSQCMRMCDLGPNVLVFPEGEVYSEMTPELADQIVDHLAEID